MADGISPEALRGMLVGQKMALVLLLKMLHDGGTLDANVYVRVLKNTFNDPEAKFERADYQYLRGLANTLTEELDLQG
jgi:hypothetical protein